ncbi:MAG: DoxX family protein [Ignavibacteriaceae bacterium]
MNNTEDILKTILAVVFLLLAAMKIFGIKPMKEVFKDFNLNRLAMILIGMIEILCVVALFIPKFAFYSCIGFTYISTSALYKHFKANHPLIKYIPGVVLLILSMITAMVLLNPDQKFP